MRHEHLSRGRLRPVAAATLAFVAGLAQAQSSPAGDAALPTVEVGGATARPGLVMPK